MVIPARTSSLALDLDPALRGALVLGWLEADGISIDALPAAFVEERDASVKRIATQLAGRQPADISGVAETRTLFHRLGVDPTKTRPSSEALLRRVLQGKGLPTVHPAVDLCNLASLEDQFPLGLYDREMIQGSRVVVRPGRAGEGYPGIRKDHVHLSGRLLLADDAGAFGAPTSDSLRTSITARTRALLVVLFCPIERPSDHRSAALERIADLLVRHGGAEIRVACTVA